jgi:hypothetical protein
MDGQLFPKVLPIAAVNLNVNKVGKKLFASCWPGLVKSVPAYPEQAKHPKVSSMCRRSWLQSALIKNQFLHPCEKLEAH